MPRERDELLGKLLKEVSRSFYLTLRVLPGEIRNQIGLAYLLARLTDTVADTGLVSVARRLEVLQKIRERIAGENNLPIELGELAGKQASDAEHLLLEKSEAVLGLLRELSPRDLELVRQVLSTITSGQELDLKRFEGASRERIVSLNTDDELDDYTYRVAGCVGEFWTRMCRAHLFPDAKLDDVWLLANGIRFGKGLQLVNILRDIAADLRNGRCYLPEVKLAQFNLRPADLLDQANEPRFRPVYDQYLHQAEAHLLAGWEYTNALPRRCRRVRLACAWPILIGLKTIKLLRVGKVLDERARLKVSRKDVKRIMFKSVLLYPWAGAWRGLAGKHR